jgi:hypothetical protein
MRAVQLRAYDGNPESHEDAPSRAVQVGLEMGEWEAPERGPQVLTTVNPRRSRRWCVIALHSLNLFRF